MAFIVMIAGDVRTFVSAFECVYDYLKDLGSLLFASVGIALAVAWYAVVPMLWDTAWFIPMMILTLLFDLVVPILLYVLARRVIQVGPFANTRFFS